MNGEPIIRFDDVTKVYPLPAGAVVALDHVSLTVEPGEFIAVMGPSGSGKSTLLNLMGCLDVPTTGRIYLSGQDISGMSDDDLTRLRREHIGFIFQQFNLIPLLSALENVEFPVILTAGREESRR
ncbi:MAG: ATP-binding cassette domain-containing protein, partial [Methanoculleus sp.]|nr:ATP-binding cassette domain-containing protein [Methanoculleus sp.]